MKTTIGHKMILASAGSGKTYALTTRFVRLLALGAEPERIVALTFTRKAAGEFFDEILNKLAAAARDDGEAAKLAAAVERPELGRKEFLRLLRAMVEAMPRLALGTLDGFFAKIVHAFPLELGLGGDFDVLQEHGAQVERRRVLRKIFTRAGAELDDAQREFIEAFKRATFGVEEKRLTARLDAFLDAHHEIFLTAPEALAWGGAGRIWPNGCRWLAGKDSREVAAKALRAWAAVACGANEKQLRRWLDFLEAVESWTPGAELAKPLVYVLEKALEKWEELESGAAELVIERKKQALPAEACDALCALVRGVFAGELQRRLEMTRGIHTVLRGYEAVYHDVVRREGRLTFADVQRLLMPGAGAPKLSADATAAEDGRLLIDWRLDAKYDHWLLDEFQDTSHGQWSVLENLIDEAVQDPEGRRTFFYVGDVKQAIYAWRGGDPRLFREIAERYNGAEPGTIEEGWLDRSYRSGPAVIAAVNRIFGDETRVAEVCPEETTKRWAKEWRVHVSAKPELDGHVAWLHADDEAARFAAALRVLQEVRPLERGLSVAVLVQSNDVAARMAEYLRAEGGLPAVAASDLRVCSDNPITLAVLALFQAAAHPGDRLAREHVAMSPLGAVLKDAGVTSQEAWTARVLGQVHADGFARTVETWLRALETRLEPEDNFSRERGRQLVDAAREFDELGGRDVAEFVAFAKLHTVAEPESPAVVRVMTIHKSKGLGFDVVVLPDLQGKKLAQKRDGLAVQRDGARSVEWVFDLPAKVFCECDDVLAKHVAEAEADAAYEKLCLYYVAMTRAKRAMYLVTEPLGKTATSANFVRLLTQTLGGVAGEVRVGDAAFSGSYQEGSADWHVHEGTVAERGETDGRDESGAGLRLAAGTVERRVRRVALRPSGAKAAVLRGAMLFPPTREASVEFGAAVHAALAGVEWLEDWQGTGKDAWLAEQKVAGRPVEAVAQARACVETAGLRPVFAKPVAARAEVWRERAFELVMDGAWVTGVFDRVVITRSAEGRAETVWIYDFKTDRAGDGAEAWAEVARRHAGQLAIYRRAAAVLAGAPREAVRCAVVLTTVARVVDVTPERS